MTRERFSARLPEKSHDILERLQEKYGTKTQVVVFALQVLDSLERGQIDENMAYFKARQKGQDDE